MENSTKRGKPLKRHPALVPLSKDHHFGLLLCWKIRKGFQKEISAERIASYARYFWQDHLDKHFLEEEQYIFPLLEEGNEKRKKAEIQHQTIRQLIVALSGGSEKMELTLGHLEKELEAHIRFEERDLFQYLQKNIEEPELEQLRLEIEEIHEMRPEIWEDRFWEE